MSRLDDSIEIVANIADCLMAYRMISRLPDCNTCTDRKCQYRPKPGEMVRINCPLWIGGKDDTDSKSKP